MTLIRNRVMLAAQNAPTEEFSFRDSVGQPRAVVPEWASL